jgi:probable addiction module antidote protein
LTLPPIYRQRKTFADFCKKLLAAAIRPILIHALSIAAKAKGMTEVAQKVGVTRASLYKSLSENGNPRFETISRIVEALGCKLVVV